MPLNDTALRMVHEDMFALWTGFKAGYKRGTNGYSPQWEIFAAWLRAEDPELAEYLSYEAEVYCTTHVQ